MMGFWTWLLAGTVPGLPYAYPIELLQFSVSNLGTVLSFVGVWEAYYDLRLVRIKRVNGKRLASAKRNLFEELARMAMHLAFLYNGWVLIRFAPPEPGLTLTADRLYQLAVTRTTTTFVIGVLTYKSYRDLRDRYRIRRMLREDPLSLYDDERHHHDTGES